MDTPTPPGAKYQEAAALFEDFPEFLRMEREKGTSYAAISGLLRDRGVIVTYESVRSWCGQLGIQKPAAA
jgi:hypothetical protein